jgi:hypothetical protein
MHVDLAIDRTRQALLVAHVRMQTVRHGVMRPTIVNSLMIVCHFKQKKDRSNLGIEPTDA